MLKNYNIAIYPGTFEFFHDGHKSIINKAMKLFEIIYIVVSNNENKNSSHIEIRYNNIINSNFVKNNKNIKVIKNEGLTIDILNMLNCYYIIRGVRSIEDFKYEMSLYDSYKQISIDFEIIYFLSDESMRKISSSSILRSNKNEN